MRTAYPRMLVIVFTAVLAGLGSTSAVANIDLVWDPPAQTVEVGETFEVGLMAVSDSPFAQSIGALQVILDWEPDKLSLTGSNENGPYDWLDSGFPVGGLNSTWLDGDAWYFALSQLLGPLPFATPEGFLITTFTFTADAETPLTEITIPESLGGFTTNIFDGKIPGLDVTGLLGTAEVTIVPEPATLLLVTGGALALLRRRRS